MKKLTNLISENQGKLTLIIAAALVVTLRFVPLSFADMYGDGAIYSFRALGWFDWLGFSGQSTPFEWLGYIPSWASLSFHDAPPLAFFVQHLSFAIFDPSVLAARLPFVLAGTASIALIYLFLKKSAGSWPASLGALLFATLSYGIWAEHSAYLEGVEGFFILGSVVFGGIFIFVKQKTSYLYFWVVFAALALLSKYTALFLIPPMVIYAWAYRSILLRYKKHIFAAIMFGVVLLLPIVIYNINVYKLRGHFDAAISSMVGMHPEDFSIISSRAPTLGLGVDYLGVFKILAHNVSYPLLILSLACSVVLIHGIRTRGWRTIEVWILVNSVFLLVVLTVAHPADRYLPIVGPFLVMITILGAVRIFERLKIDGWRYAFGILVVAVFAFELLYSLNTNAFKNPIGPSGWLYSENKLQNLGFNQLEGFLLDKVIVPLPKMHAVRIKQDTVFTNEDIEGRSIVVFDDRIDWFAQMWYMQKYLLYYRWPVISTSFLASVGSGDTGLQALLEASGKPMYFVYPMHGMVIDKARDADPAINSAGPAMSKRLDEASVPVWVIENVAGTPVFKVYEITKI